MHGALGLKVSAARVARLIDSIHETTVSSPRWPGTFIRRCFSSFSATASAKGLPEAQPQNILENKGGLEVSDYGQFGTLMLGEQRELVIWIQ